MADPDPLGLYIHWPFCLSKCPYCDFNVHVRKDIDQPRWRAAYLKSLEHYAHQTRGKALHSIYLGGGTPSLIDPQTVKEIIDRAHALWNTANDIEITLEANPTSVEIDRLKAFKDAGVNRVSLGVQALNDQDLKFLGRTHSVDQALQAIETAQGLFERMNFDLIYARPNQTLEDWSAELEQAVALVKGHLSLYQLTIERNTPFYFDYEQGKFSIPEEDAAADFYLLTNEVLERGGLPMYEVSNYASKGQQSRHNKIYWRYQDYIGIGPGAHGRLSLNGVKHATREHHAPDIWLDKVEQGGSGAHPYQKLSRYEAFTESLMMGLRLREGVPFQQLEQASGTDWDTFLEHEKLNQCYEQGWLSKTNQALKLSPEGLLRLNALISFILRPKPIAAVAD